MIERLIEVRSRIVDGSEAAENLDQAISVLSKRIKKSSYPLGREQLSAMGGGYAVFIGSVIAMSFRIQDSGTESLSHEWPLMFAAAGGLGLFFVGSFAPRREPVP